MMDNNSIETITIDTNGNDEERFCKWVETSKEVATVLGLCVACYDIRGSDKGTMVTFVCKDE